MSSYFNQNKHSEFFSTNSDDLSFSRNLVQSYKTVNEALIRAWSDCMEGYSGLFQKVEVSPNDPNQFHYFIVYGDGTLDNVRLRIENATCDPTLDRTLTVDGSGDTFLCRRVDPKQNVRVSMNSRAGIPRRRPTVLEIPPAPRWYGLHTEDYITGELMPTGEDAPHVYSPPLQAISGCEFKWEDVKPLGDLRLKWGVQNASRTTFTWWVHGPRPGPGPDAGKGIRISVPSYVSPDLKGAAPATCGSPAQ
jgi:hypothetical protein